MMFRHSASLLHPSARGEVGLLLITTFQTQERQLSKLWGDIFPNNTCV